MTTMRSREVERVLASVGASVFITVDRWDGYGYAAAAAEMAPRLPALRHRVVIGRTVREGETDFVRFFQQESHPAPAVAPVDPDAVALVLFTSGTTGQARGVLSNLNNWYATVLAKLPGDGTKLHRFTPQSLMHAIGVLSFSLSLITGGVTLLVDRWEPRRVAGLLAEAGVEQMVLVPSFLGEFLGALREEGTRLPRLRDVTVGGTAVSSAVVDETAELLGDPVRMQWGMTEGGLVLTGREDPPDWALHSIGRPGPGTEAELRPWNEAAEISEENPGRLMIRGASLCLATMGRDSGALQVLADHDDGWYDTGDLAVPDGRGGYRLVGRVSDRIGGAFMIPVADVENVLRAHPHITDVAVVGYRDGIEGCAVVVSTVPVTLGEVRSFLSETGMTEWYWPTRVERVDAWPPNQLGKVEKARLRAWVAERSAAGLGVGG
jgi:cyclohexanecarboxylate-CoA ligase